jgi:predicted acetyltransferase
MNSSLSACTLQRDQAIFLWKKMIFKCQNEIKKNDIKNDHDKPVISIVRVELIMIQIMRFK